MLDGQSNCSTCLDVWAQYTADAMSTCQGCKPNCVHEMYDGNQVCRPIYLVKEGRTISYVIGSIYFAVAIGALVWWIAIKAKNAKKAQEAK